MYILAVVARLVMSYNSSSDHIEHKLSRQMNSLEDWEMEKKTHFDEPVNLSQSLDHLVLYWQYFFPSDYGV
jgi:hypothetical protein